MQSTIDARNCTSATYGRPFAVQTAVAEFLAAEGPWPRTIDMVIKPTGDCLDAANPSDLFGIRAAVRAASDRIGIKTATRMSPGKTSLLVFKLG